MAVSPINNVEFSFESLSAKYDDFHFNSLTIEVLKLFDWIEDLEIHNSNLTQEDLEDILLNKKSLKRVVITHIEEQENEEPNTKSETEQFAKNLFRTMPNIQYLQYNGFKISFTKTF